MATGWVTCIWLACTDGWGSEGTIHCCRRFSSAAALFSTAAFLPSAACPAGNEDDGEADSAQQAARRETRLAQAELKVGEAVGQAHIAGYVVACMHVAAWACQPIGRPCACLVAAPLPL